MQAILKGTIYNADESYTYAAHINLESIGAPQSSSMFFNLETVGSFRFEWNLTRLRKRDSAKQRGFPAPAPRAGKSMPPDGLADRMPTSHLAPSP